MTISPVILFSCNWLLVQVSKTPPAGLDSTFKFGDVGTKIDDAVGLDAAVGQTSHKLLFQHLPAC